MEFFQNIAEYILNQLVGFFIGALASFVASIYYAKWLTYRNNKQFTSLIDVWIEFNDVLTDRPFSICTFYFSSEDGKLKLKGDSYDNDGNVFYQWWSVVMHIDDRERRMSYVYETQRVGDTKKDEGFGCYTLHFNSTLNQWDISRGYFQDLEEARPRFCKMVRFSEVADHLKRKLDANSEQEKQLIIKELITLRSTPDIQNLFGWQK